MCCSSSSSSAASDAGRDDPTSSKADGPRRLSSLLQHDIVIAAQAREAKGQVKAKTPTPREKPKDAADMFREELAKAATAREERAKSTNIEEKPVPSDNQDESAAVVFQSDLIKVKRKSAVNEVAAVSPPKTSDKVMLNGSATPVKEPPPTMPKPTSPTGLTKQPNFSSPIISAKSDSDLLSGT